MSEAALRDKGLVESWKSDMDGTLIFVCFLSWLIINKNLIDQL